MAKKEPVGVNWQSLFVIIPIVNLWAFYRVEKFRLYLLFIIALVATEISIEILLFGVDAWENQELGESGYILQVVYFAFEIGISVGLIRKWSKEWNEKLA